MKENLYVSSQEWPAHLSAGAVLLNDRNEVALHYFPADKVHPWGEKIYLLMRETVRNNEPLEAAVARGLMEEFGATGEIMVYLDSKRDVLAPEPHAYVDNLMHKTTLYFLVRLSHLDETKREPGAIESTSVITWMPLPQAAKVMIAQAERLPHRDDLHEVEVIRWAQKYLEGVVGAPS